MFYLLGKLIIHVRNRRAARRAGNDTEAPSNQPVKSPQEVTTFSGIHLSTPEGRNMLAVSVCGLVAAFDFTASLMSLQPLYFILRGDPHLYGFCLGVYDLALICVAPITSYYLDRTNNFGMIFKVCMLLSILGNCLYATCLYMYAYTSVGLDAWKVLIASRAIMGMGSVNILTGSTYITRYTAFNRRIGAMGSYQLWQTAARMLGPTLGFLFLGMPFPSDRKPDPVVLVFNFYTMSTWLMVILSVVGLAIFTWFFDVSKVKEVHGVHDIPYDVWKAPKGPGSLFFKIAINTAVVFLFGFVDFSILSQMFAFSTVTFGEVNNQYDIWKPYVGVGAGAMLGSLIWRRTAARLLATHPRQEIGWASIGVMLGFLVPWFFLTYGHHLPLDAKLLYAGATILGASQVMAFGNFEVIFSKQITQHLVEVGSSTGSMFSLYGITFSLSKFLGPFVTGYILTVYDTVGPSGIPCARGMNSTCCFSPESFSTETCAISDNDDWLGALVGISAVATIGGMYYLWAVVDYNADVGKEMVDDAPNNNKVENGGEVGNE